MHRYLIAVGSVVLALVVRLAVAPWLFATATYMPFFFAVAATAAAGGVRPGLVATALSIALSAYLLLPPERSFWIDSPSDRLQLLFFAAMAGCLCWLSGSLYHVRRRAEREQGRRRAEQERFRLAADAVNAIVYEFDFATGRVERQRGLYEVVGYHPAEVPPTAAWWWEQIHPDDREGVEKRFMEAVGNSVVREYRVRHKDGRWLHVEDRAVLVRGADGRPVRMVGCTVDVTAHRQADAELRRREAFISGILGSITDGFFVVDKDWRFTFANDEIVRRFGRERNEIIGGRVWEMFPDAVGNEAYARMHRAMADRVAVEYEVFHPPWRRWFLDKVFPTADGGLAVYTRDITDRKQAEERLRESERRLKLATDAAALGLHDHDVRADRIGWDERVRELWGVSPDEPITYDTFLAGLHPDDRAATLAAVSRALDPNGDGRYSAEYRVANRADGSVRWVAATGLTSFEDGQAVRLVGTVQDVTARKVAEEERERTAATLNSLIASAPVGVVLLDAEMRFRHINRPLAEMNGLPAEAHLGKTVAEVVPGLYESLRPLFERVLDKGEIVPDFILVGETPKAPGVKRVWRESWFPVAGADGRPAGVGAIVQEITEQRRAEERLRFQLDLTKSITDNATTAIFMMDDKSRCTFMNPAAERMTGYTFQEVEGGILHDFIHHHRPDGRPYPMPDCPIDRALPEGGEVRDHEDLFFRKGGEAFPVMCNARVVYEGGVPVGTVIEVRDITTEKAAADELRRLMADLSEADKRKDEFLATLAHELRNPLAPLRSGLQIMKLAGGNPDAVEKSRAMMERQVGQMAHLIDDLMDLSRISRGKIVLQKTRLRLTDAVQDAVDTARPLIEERGHELVLDVPPEPLHVEADRTRLAQIFGNLLNNAAKYTDPGGRIRVAVERQGGDVVVSVEDNGVGIPAHSLTRVFDMFAQVDHSLEKSQGGLGIGLNIVKRLVEMHGGGIAAESGGRGAGSRFVVRLPVASTVATDSPGDPDGVRKAKPARRRILVADDNRDGATSLAELLSIMGNDTQAAFDGQEAVAVAEAFRPDVILMDIGMPKLNGYEACRRIRGEAWGRDIVIVAQTGWGQEDDKRKSQEAGFDFHLVKPVDPAALEKMLAELQATTG